MARDSAPLFREEQKFRQRRLLLLTAIPPVILTCLAIWQAGLGHAWGKQPMSNAGIVAWAVFLWLIYLRLITVKLVTELRPGELRVAMRGLWRSSRILLPGIQSVSEVTFDPAADWGGYGIRTSARGTAYVARGTRGVELRMRDGKIIVIGSQRPGELARAISAQLRITP